MSIHICAPPSRVEYPLDAEVLWVWCFKCRYYTNHHLGIIFDLSGWYEPQSFYACENCHGDHRRMW